MSLPDGEDESRLRQQRKSLLAKAIFSHHGGGSVGVRVRNLSASGLGGVADKPLIEGEEYSVALRGIGDVLGTIAWVDDDRFGMRFADTIDLDKLEMADLAEVKIVGCGDVQPHYPPPGDFKRPGVRTR